MVVITKFRDEISVLSLMMIFVPKTIIKGVGNNPKNSILTPYYVFKYYIIKVRFSKHLKIGLANVICLDHDFEAATVVCEYFPVFCSFHFVAKMSSVVWEVLRLL